MGIFHEVFGHPSTKILQKNIFSDNPKLVNFRLSLIEEEKNELKEACEKEDFIEAVDAISDILFVTYGMCHVFGICYNKDEGIPHLQYKNVKCEDNTGNLFVFSQDNEKLTTQLNTLEYDVSSLKHHCDEKNMSNVINDIHMIVCTCYTISSLFRVDIDKCFGEVFRSNMTKVCLSEDEAKDTVEWYKQNEKRYADPSYRQASNGKYWVVFDKVTSKILKSIKFELPNLMQVIFGENGK